MTEGLKQSAVEGDVPAQSVIIWNGAAEPVDVRDGDQWVGPHGRYLRVDGHWERHA